MSLGETIRNGTKWLFIQKAGSQTLQFIFGVVLARILVPADFGLLVTIQIFTGIAGFVAGGGTGQSLVREKNVEPHDFQAIFSLQLLIGIVIYGLFFFSAPHMAVWLGSPLYEPLVRLSAISFLLRPFQNVLNSFLHREMLFQKLAWINMSSLVFSSIISISLASQGYGVWSLVWGGIAGSIFRILILQFNTPLPLRFKWRQESIRRLAPYGIRVSLNNIADYIYQQTPNFILTRLLGPQTVGLYNKSSSLALLPMNIIGTAPYQAIFRILSEIQDDHNQSTYIYYRTITLVSLYTLPFYIGLFWVAEPFITTIYGEQWRGAAKALEILALTGIFLCVSNPSGAVIEARNQIGKEVYTKLTATAILAVGALFLTDGTLSIESLAYLVLSTEFFIAISLYIIASRSLGGTLTLLINALKPTLIMNAGLALFLWLLSSLIQNSSLTGNELLYLLIMVPSGGCFYGLFFLFFTPSPLQSEAERWKFLVQKNTV